MKSYSKSIILLSLFLGLIFLMILLIANLHIFFENNDLSEISKNNFRQKLEYASERGFGNDRFDIYSFYLLKENELSDFEKLDDNYYNKYKYTFLNNNIFVDKESQILKDNIYEEIKLLEKNSDTKYLYVENESTRKLSIYSSSANKGYCFLLVT